MQDSDLNLLGPQPLSGVGSDPDHDGRFWAGKRLPAGAGRQYAHCRVEANNLGANGIVAGGVPIAVGVGLSIRMRKTSQVCLVIFGDGAANEGAFHESLNMASIWKLPVIYLCENNQYAMSMPVQKALTLKHQWRRRLITSPV
jgi:TPP-dependent pyruvate/acetoin dehydrogenase alpha subunit